MKQAAVYIRVSTEEQTEYSPDAQLKKIKEYALSHNILILPDHIYIENGVSGRTVAKREQFRKMISAAKVKPKLFDVVLIHAYDRFARNAKESRIYKELLRNDLGIELISITEDFGTGKNSFLMEGIKDILNEYYSLNLRDEVLKGMYEKISRGEVCTGASFGYNMINKKLIINKKEARIVKLIFTKYAYSNMALLDIAKYLNSMGIRTKKGALFENRTVKYILRNPTYIGYLRYSKNGKTNYHSSNNVLNANLYKGVHEPIIDKELWDVVQSRLDKNQIFSKPHQINTFAADYWLKGLVRCSVCGSTLVRNGKKNLRCNGYGKGRCKCHFSFLISELEDIILQQLKKDFNSKEINLNFVQIKNKDSNEKELLESKINSLARKLLRIKDAYMNGVDTLEEYKANKEMINKEISKTKNEIKNVKVKYEPSKTQIKSKIKDVYNLLTDESIDAKIKREAANTIIHSITIDSEHKQISLKYNISPL